MDSCKLYANDQERLENCGNCAEYFGKIIFHYQLANPKGRYVTSDDAAEIWKKTY